MSVNMVGRLNRVWGSDMETMFLIGARAGDAAGWAHTGKKKAVATESSSRLFMAATRLAMADQRC
jgi:hypothetical protein